MWATQMSASASASDGPDASGPEARAARQEQRDGGERQRADEAVRRVVDRRADARAGEIAEEAEVGREKGEREEAPAGAEAAVEHERRGEHRQRLQLQQQLHAAANRPIGAGLGSARRRCRATHPRSHHRRHRAPPRRLLLVAFKAIVSSLRPMSSPYARYIVYATSATTSQKRTSSGSTKRAEGIPAMRAAVRKLRAATRRARFRALGLATVAKSVSSG